MTSEKLIEFIERMVEMYFPDASSRPVSDPIKAIHSAISFYKQGLDNEVRQP